ncbi:hypothetical protein SLS62_005235 [Diatrype stigma]|uniref:Uncharacterized protein n=1 Tax=Diatrype stigma TaxID=117547 RepID=A0AAN9UTI2_9PEZI
MASNEEYPPGLLQKDTEFIDFICHGNRGDAVRLLLDQARKIIYGHGDEGVTQLLADYRLGKSHWLIYIYALVSSLKSPKNGGFCIHYTATAPGYNYVTAVNQAGPLLRDNFTPHSSGNPTADLDQWGGAAATPSAAWGGNYQSPTQYPTFWTGSQDVSPQQQNGTTAGANPPSAWAGNYQMPTQSSPLWTGNPNVGSNEQGQATAIASPSPAWAGNPIMDFSQIAGEPPINANIAEDHELAALIRQNDTPSQSDQQDMTVYNVLLGGFGGQGV